MDSKTLIELISDKLDIDPQIGTSIYNSLCSIIGEKGEALDSVGVPGFGTFESKKRLERINVHPATGKRMLLPPKVVMGFKPSAILKQKINPTQS